MGLKRAKRKTPPAVGPKPRETRWCERHGYVIDIDACRSRARKNPRCRRCYSRWRQIPLPL